MSCADPVEPEPELEVTTTATSQCTGARAQVTARAVNEEDFPVDVVVTTPYGTKTFNNVQPGKSASQKFNSRSEAIEAGTVTFTATATVDGKEVTTTTERSFEATSCR